MVLEDPKFCSAILSYCSDNKGQAAEHLQIFLVFSVIERLLIFTSTKQYR